MLRELCQYLTRMPMIMRLLCQELVLGCPGDREPCDGQDFTRMTIAYDDAGAVSRLDPLKICARRNWGVCDSSLLQGVGQP